MYLELFTARSQSLFKQPKAVFAVAFACVVSFMGIGLVDPILPALSTKLNATPSQVSLLFTSYLLVIAVAMLFTGWVSIGRNPAGVRSDGRLLSRRVKVDNVCHD
ncbi:hypothetical protein AB0F72_38030 [Actinoplanes sp. NPDC023936]|uniref:hypothetical protein n=1 Tax=Actinoplanes sp. NPDC023936 TaxID=3154910 RepID=UPI0033CA00BB